MLHVRPLGPVQLKRHGDSMVRQELLDVIAGIQPLHPFLAAGFELISVFPQRSELLGSSSVFVSVHGRSKPPRIRRRPA